MKINTRLKQLRLAAGLSQEAIATTGVCSTPGWIKIENGQRDPSEKLLVKLVTFLVIESIIPKNRTKSLTEELLTLKYMSVKSPFLRELATEHAKTLPDAERLLAPEPKVKSNRGRPAGGKKAVAALAGQTYDGKGKYTKKEKRLLAKQAQTAKSPLQQTT